MAGSNIFLIGFMGAGKTSVGKKLARRLGVEFIDMDDEIVKADGRDIPTIFAEKGEEFFRELESKVLKQISMLSRRVISCGGGVILKDSNVSVMKSSGLVVWLMVSVDEVIKRLAEDNTRPLLQVEDPVERVVHLLNMRTPLYEKAADIKIDTDGKDIGDIVEEILENLESKKWI